jgi:hypothetical protein
MPGSGPSVGSYSGNQAKVKPVTVAWYSGNSVVGRRGAGKRGLAQGRIPLREQERRLLRLLEQGPERTLFRGLEQTLLRAQARELLRQQGR